MVDTGDVIVSGGKRGKGRGEREGESKGEGDGKQKTPVSLLRLLTRDIFSSLSPLIHTDHHRHNFPLNHTDYRESQ